MSMPLPLAELVSSWANWALVGALVVGVLATYAIVVSGNVKEAAMKGELAASRERIIANETATARATAELDIAKAAAAEANERAAKAELELAKYRAPRTLTPEQHRTLVELLTLAPKGRVIVKPNFVDMEATGFANQISQVFTEAGFTGVGDAPLEILSINRAGVILAVRDANAPPPHTLPILSAFKEAGISVESGPADWVPDVDTVVIMIGRKP